MKIKIFNHEICVCALLATNSIMRKEGCLHTLLCSAEMEVKMQMNKYQISCPYCGSPAIFRPAAMVHGSSILEKGRYLYVCSRFPECDSYVAAHKKDKSPMGTLADRELRHKRILAHNALAELQKIRHMEKWAAYLWLQGKLGLTEEQAHIGLFSGQMCDRVISLCHQALETCPQMTA